MKILYIILFIQIGWIFPLSAQKQDSIYIGTRHTLFSEILNEERKYWIYVPETKAGEKGKAYPRYRQERKVIAYGIGITNQPYCHPCQIHPNGTPY